MKLIRMTLENFKGIKHAEFAFGGYDANIYGANGTGKTTIYDAFTWLMFGKSSGEKANFSPKTITAEGAAHNIDHSVECEIEIDGAITTFKRVYHEVYKRSRGNAESVLSGHTTDYYIDGVPKKEKEYQKFWADIFENDEQVKLLTMPFYFSESLHWEKRRGILLEICGNVSDLDIMESDSELRNLAEILNGKPVDEYKKIIKAKKQTINKQLELIPARIDEATKAIPSNIPTDTIEVLKERAEELRKAISEEEQNKAALLTGNGVQASIRAEIAELNAQLLEAKAKFNEHLSKLKDNALAKVQEIRKTLSDAESEMQQNTRTLDEAKRRASEIETKREYIMSSYKEKQKEYADLEQEKFDENSAYCDKCGQALPTDKVSELKARFNENKSNRLAEMKKAMSDLIEDGKQNASKEMLAEAQSLAEEATTKVNKTAEKISNINQELETATIELEKTAPLSVFEDTEEYKVITDKISKLQNSDISTPNTDVVDSRIDALRTAEATVNSSISALETEIVQKKRIADLEYEERNLGQEYESAERELYLCEKFTRVKSALLNDKINEKFKSVKFQLFKQNITNDGIDDICDVLVPTVSGAFVPFGDANNAARINAGIEIIETLGEYYGVEVPIFVDNAESVTKIVPTKGQLIRLVVSESDNELRLETL